MTPEQMAAVLREFAKDDEFEMKVHRNSILFAADLILTMKAELDEYKRRGM